MHSTAMPAHQRLRRVVATAIAAIGLVTALTACSGTSTSAGSDASASTRTVSTVKGRVTVPAHPKRIVSVHSWTTESLFDFGEKPVGVENGGEQYVPKRYVAKWKAADKVASGSTLDLEKIAALKPDLIVGVDVPYLDKYYKKLSQIAPTTFTKFTADWTTSPKQTASFVNDNSKLAELQTTFRHRIATDKKHYASKLSSLRFDVIQGGFDEGNYWVYSTKSAVGQILQQLGASFASATTSVKAGSTNSVSYEKADLLNDADAIVYYQNSDGTPANNIDKLFALQTFKDLKANKHDLVIGTPDFLPGSYSDGLGILRSIEKGLEKA